MNLLGHLLKKSSPYAGSGSGMVYSGGAPYVDLHQKTRAPSAFELVRENLGTAYACGSYNSTLIAKTRLRLYISTKRGEGQSRLSKYGRTKAVTMKSFERLEKSHSERVTDAADIEEVKDHPVLTLLRRPNGILQDGVGMSMFTLIETNQLNLEIVGRSYFYAERDGPGGTPSQLWVLAPQYVTEWPGAGEDAKIIDHYEFALGSGNRQYGIESIVPFRFPDPATGGYTGGLSPLRACFEAHRLARQVDSITNARITNGGRPDAVFIPKGDDSGGGSIGRDEAARLEMMLKRRYAMAGAGHISVADIPGDIKPIAWPINDVIDSARYILTRAQIAEAYHVPLSKLNRDSANRASAQSGDYAHAIDAGLPRLRRNEAALNTFLLPMYGEEAAARLFFAFDDPPGMEDPDQEQKRLELAVKSGAFKNNELRSLCGKEDVPEGEQFLASNTLVPLLPNGKPDPTYIKGAAGGPPDDAGGSGAPAKGPVQAPAAPAEPKPKKKKSGAAKAMLKMAKAVTSMVAERGERNEREGRDSELRKSIVRETVEAVREMMPPAAPVKDDAVEPEPLTKAVDGVKARMKSAGYSDEEIEQKIMEARGERPTEIIKAKVIRHEWQAPPPPPAEPSDLALLLKAVSDIATRPPAPLPVTQPIIVNVPEQPAPIINVTVPQQPAPIVNVQAATIPAPEVVVNVAAQPAPQVTVNVPEQPTPVVHVHPSPKTVSKIVRDQYGEIIEVQHD